MALETKLSIFESDRETDMNDRYNEIVSCINYELSSDLEKWQMTAENVSKFGRVTSNNSDSKGCPEIWWWMHWNKY